MCFPLMSQVERSENESPVVWPSLPFFSYFLLFFRCYPLVRGLVVCCDGDREMFAHHSLALVRARIRPCLLCLSRLLLAIDKSYPTSAAGPLEKKERIANTTSSRLPTWTPRLVIVTEIYYPVAHLWVRGYCQVGRSATLWPFDCGMGRRRSRRKHTHHQGYIGQVVVFMQTTAKRTPIPR